MEDLSVSRSSFPLRSACCFFLISSFSSEHLPSSPRSCSCRTWEVFCRSESSPPPEFRL